VRDLLPFVATSTANGPADRGLRPDLALRLLCLPELLSPVESLGALKISANHGIEQGALTLDGCGHPVVATMERQRIAVVRSHFHGCLKERLNGPASGTS
jgi:hypothetical protein